MQTFLLKSLDIFTYSMRFVTKTLALPFVHLLLLWHIHNFYNPLWATICLSKVCPPLVICLLIQLSWHPLQAFTFIIPVDKIIVVVTVFTKYVGAVRQYVSLCFSQEEYVSEGLQWSFIKYQDNQSCLDLIEGSPLSVFSLLNEVSRC